LRLDRENEGFAEITLKRCRCGKNEARRQNVPDVIVNESRRSQSLTGERVSGNQSRTRKTKKLKTKVTKGNCTGIKFLYGKKDLVHKWPLGRSQNYILGSREKLSGGARKNGSWQSREMRMNLKFWKMRNGLRGNGTPLGDRSKKWANLRRGRNDGIKTKSWKKEPLGGDSR